MRQLITGIILIKQGIPGKRRGSCHQRWNRFFCKSKKVTVITSEKTFDSVCRDPKFPPLSFILTHDRVSLTKRLRLKCYSSLELRHKVSTKCI